MCGSCPYFGKFFLWSYLLVFFPFPRWLFSSLPGLGSTPPVHSFYLHLGNSGICFFSLRSSMFLGSLSLALVLTCNVFSPTVLTRAPLMDFSSFFAVSGFFFHQFFELLVVWFQVGACIYFPSFRGRNSILCKVVLFVFIFNI